LHCMYYNTMLVVHRASLFGTPHVQINQRTHPRMAAADAVCLNSARSLSRSLTELVRRQHCSSVFRYGNPDFTSDNDVHRFCMTFF
jgi:hypothetical protein